MILSLVGGLIIGLSVTWMLLFNGRITGISGIINNIFVSKSWERGWRLSFVLGLISGGLLLKYSEYDLLSNLQPRSFPVLIIAGLLVGLGTILANGCTSGHGICGLSRFSKRSLVATIVFMSVGIITATIFRMVTT